MFELLGFLIIPLVLVPYTHHYIKNKLKQFERINVIFDLDNTLIMSIYQDKYLSMSHYHKPNIIDFKSGDDSKIRVIWSRPYIKPVLYILSKFCNLYLFTKAGKNYADKILENLQIKDYFKMCLFKDTN